MADISDIEGALVTLIAGALFPSTTYQPGAVNLSASGTNARVYRGWPGRELLSDDLAQGRAHVSIFPESGMTRNVTRWFPETVQVATVTPTITAVASGLTVTLGGTVTAGNVVGVASGAPIAAYAYKAVAGDTLTTIAAALATKAGATSVGAVITMPTSLNLHAAVMVPQPALTVTRQQEQGFRISVWAPSPHARDTLCSAIDGGISGLRNANGFFTRFFPIGAYESARIAARTTYVDDMPSRERVWRRDLCYTVEYPTTLLEMDPIALFIGGANWTNGVLNQFGTLQPSDSVIASGDGLSIFLDVAGNVIGAQPT